MQRIQNVNNGICEARTQIQKIFDHKAHVTDIIQRNSLKCTFK